MKKSVYYPSCRNKYQCRLPFLVGSNNQIDYNNTNNTANAVSSIEENETVPLSSNCKENILKVENDDNNIMLEVNADDFKEIRSSASQIPSKKIVEHSTIINLDEDDEMTVTGYRRSMLFTMICWFCFIITAGVLRLIMHWRQHLLLLATHKKCTLDVAEMVLIKEDFEGKHAVYYVERVITLDRDTIRHMKKKKKEKSVFLPPEDKINEVEDSDKQYELSIHMSDGYFKNVDSLRFFKCKQLRYVWDETLLTFVKLRGLDIDVPAILFHQLRGLDKKNQRARQLVYGLNQIYIPIKSVFELLFLEVLNPYYVFQVFSVCLWFSYDYYYYATVIVLMSAFGITMSIVQTKKNQMALYKTVFNTENAMVVRSDGTTHTTETKYLVPGDILEIPSRGCTMQCDAVLLSGNCILDESTLTGESVPITKTPLTCKQGLIFNAKEQTRHVLFSGTKIIQTRYIGTEKVLACVINTGNITAKGGLIRSILYPPPVDYKFEQDSYKFIMLLGVIAGMGFIYTLFTKIYRGVSAMKIIIESLDLITIAVPPALPAAITVGRFYAQKRLEKNNIYCISPRSITIAGSIDCVCFDKTGTLTEDGLDMWGVIPTSLTNVLQMPLRQVNRLPCDHLLFGMVTCHSITMINGEMKGDPLDLKMFESTGWVLEEANISDDMKYDLLFPTIVRPPKKGNNQSKSNSTNNSMDNVSDFDEISAARRSIAATEDSDNLDIGIVREFSFTSSLQRMSVVTRRLTDKHFNVYTKGSPEMISTLCKPESIPIDFHTVLDIYAQQGYRIIALSYKSLDKKMTYAKVQRVGREKIECDLNFLGFVILENRLKPDTLSIINNLMAANIRTVMVTGDNILTALSVAKDCNMIQPDEYVVSVNARQRVQSNQWELVYNLIGRSIKSTYNNANEKTYDLPTSITNNHLYLNANEHQRPNGFVASNSGNIVNSNSYALLTTNSNSAVSLDTIDTCTQTTQITHRDIESGPLKSYEYDDENNPLKSPLDKTNNNYRFAMNGKTWNIIRDEFPELLPRFVTRGTVFARMSPDQKQTLILELQNLGYYVGMCGDGANDCGALKAAHTGISLSEAESSVASPFTSKNPTIACVPNIIKEGRCALVTSVAIFKFMAAYSLVQFASVLILYSIDSNLTDIEFLYIDLFMISVFAFFFGKTESYVGPLNKKAPLNSLISFSPVASLLIHLVLAIGFQVIGWLHLKQQTWFEPFVYDESKEFEHACYENYTIFTISCFQYIILAIVFSKGAPYRKSIFTNYGFLCSLTLNTIVSIILALAPFTYLTQQFDLKVPPDMLFRVYLIGYGLVNFLLSLVIEVYLIDKVFFNKLRYKFHNPHKSRRTFLSVENSLRKLVDWPPLTQFGSDIDSNCGVGSLGSPSASVAITAGGNSDDIGTNQQSPKSFTEICVESECRTHFDSVLRVFFNDIDNNDSESAHINGSESDRNEQYFSTTSVPDACASGYIKNNGSSDVDGNDTKNNNQMSVTNDLPQLDNNFCNSNDETKNMIILGNVDSNSDNKNSNKAENCNKDEYELSNILPKTKS